jgi:hypothetical protein
VKEFADTLKSFGVSRIHGDRYAGEWPREAFRKCGVEYRVADKTKSDLHLALLPLLKSGRVELLDHKRLVAQLCGLERRTSLAGRDSIDHVPGGHDDVANAVAGATVLAAQAAARPADQDRVALICQQAGSGSALAQRTRPASQRRNCFTRPAAMAAVRPGPALVRRIGDDQASES